MLAFLHRNAWIVPLLFALLLGGVGGFSYRELRDSTKEQIADELEIVRDIAAKGVRTWAKDKRAQAEVHAADHRVVEYTQARMRSIQGVSNPRATLLPSPYQQRIRERVGPAVEKYGFAGFASLSPGGLYVAAAQDPAVGIQAPSGVGELLPRLLRGETVLTRPLAPERLGPGADGQSLMLVGAPLRDDDGEVFAAFGFSIRPGDDFARILHTARAGESGETYVFSKRGRLLSPSRFGDQLREIGCG